MNSEKSNVAKVFSANRTGMLCGTLAAVVIAVACSNHPKPNLNSEKAEGVARPAVLKTVATTMSEPVSLNAPASNGVAKPLSKTINYKSRDYGVSFEYPRQYAYVSAKTVANGDASLKPKADGTNTQFTLASVEIPKGFYPDTDFERGYFTVSLNEDLTEEECQAVIGPAKAQTENINGVDFRWVETDNGGSGESAKIRNYVAYTNATCYELELGEKSKNEKGLAREVNPDQVFKRLDAIAATVKIKQTLLKPVGSVQESAGK
jgi:hypothetical protein